MLLMLGDTFTRLKAARELPVETPVKVLWADGATYIYSPDGDGCFYYDSFADLEEQH